MFEILGILRAGHSSLEARIFKFEGDGKENKFGLRCSLVCIHELDMN